MQLNRSRITRDSSGYFSRDKHLFLLALISIIIFISHGLYVSKTFQHPKWDEHIFLMQAVATYDEIKSPSLNTLGNLSEIFEIRPPIYGLSISFMFLFTNGENVYKSALFTNAIWYIISIVGIYFLANKFMGKTPSLIASLLFATYGFPLFYLHFVYSETATTAFVVLTLFSLVYSDNFSNRKFSTLAGIFLFLGNITRWVTPIFVAGGLLAVVFQSLYKSKKAKRHVIFKNILIFLITGIGLSFFAYYLPNYEYFSGYVSNTTKEAPEWVESLNYLPSGMSNPFSTHSVMFYFNILSQQTVYLFALFVAGFLVCLVQFRKYIFLLLSFIIPYYFFTFLSILKDDRYIVPVYPVMAIISAVVVDKVKNPMLRNLLILAVVIISSLNLLGASWGIGPLGQQGLKDIVLPEVIRHPRRIYMTTMVWPPIENVTNAREIFYKTQIHYQGSSSPTVLNTYTVNPLELDVALTSLAQFEERGEFYPINLRVINPGDYHDFFSRLDRADFVLVRSMGEPIKDEKFATHEDGKMIKIFNRAYEASSGKILSSFTRIDKVYYPLDKVYLDIYRKDDKLTYIEVLEIGNYLAQIDSENRENILEAVNKFK